jgi:hypothetical protein
LAKNEEEEASRIVRIKRINADLSDAILTL